MSQFRTLILIGLCGIVLLSGSGCGGSSVDENSPVVATFRDKTLTARMVAHYIPDGATPEDSLRYAQQFVQQWIKEQAICDRALSTDETLEERVAYKVQDYRAKIIMHAYHTSLIEDSLDKRVPEAECKEYYELNKENFRSKENLYSFLYIVTTNRNTAEVAEWMRKDGQEEFGKVAEWAAQNGMEYKLDSAYVGESKIAQISKGYFGNLQKAEPGKLIRWNGVISGERRRYLFKMLDMVKEGEALPLRLCREKIKNLIINDRKVKLIERTEKKIVRDARASNYVREY